MRLGLGLGVNSITSQKVGAGFTGLLDTYTGAAAAYSVRRLSSTYTGSAMKVRRSSDDALQDIGFDGSGNLDTSALLSFVGGGDGHVTRWYSQSGFIDTYNSDFSSGVDSFSPTTNNSVTRVASATDDHGTTVNNVLKLNCDNTNSDEHVARKVDPLPSTGSIANLALKCSFKLLVPTSNTTLVRAAISNGNQTTAGIVDGGKVTEKGRWVQFTDVAWTQINQARLTFMGLNSSDGVTFSATADDHFFIADIVLNQTTDIYNETGSQQPQIVNSGSIIEDGGKAALFIDQTTTHGLDIPVSGSSTQDFFQVHKTNDDRFILLKDSNSGSRFAYAAIDGNTSTDLNGNYGSPSLFVNGSAESPANRDALHTLLSTNSQVLMSSIGGNSSGWTGNIIWGKYSSANVYDGNVQEIIFFNSDQSSNRTGIETNINGYFSIY